MMLKVYQGAAGVDELQTSGRAAAAAAKVKAGSQASAPDDDEDDSPYRTTVVHPGSAELPPLIEVPGGALPLASIVKPPDADSLWEWELERGNSDADPSWASVWPAAANLANHIAQDATLVRGKRVAELGAGLGVAGLSAAACGAKSVVLIDREPFALHCAMSTAVVCGLPTGPVPGTSDAEGGEEGGDKGVVSASVRDWNALASDGLEVDLVLASEVLYDPSQAAPLATCAARLLAKGGTLLLADPAAGRVATARAAATEALVALGAAVSEVPLEAPPAGDGWYSVRSGDSRTGAVSLEPIVLLQAVFERPPRL